jgi:hypothetical protein
MKGSDFIKKLNETLGITIPEETLTKLSEIEVPDEFQAKHQEIFISKERAKHEPEIIEAITKEDRKTQFRIVDEKIKTFLPLIGQDQATVITNTFETYKKLDMLTTAVGDAIKNAKGKVSEDVRKVEEEWAAKVRLKEEDFAKQIAAKETEFKDKQVENIMRSKLLSYNWADAFQPVKEALSKAAIVELKSKPYVFDLETDGSVAIRRKDEGGVLRDVFEDEKRLTIDKVLDKFVDPYVKKSNPDTTNQPPQASGTPQPRPAMPEKVETLAERRAAAAALK